MSTEKLSELSNPVAEVVSKFGDPEAFGEREIKLLTGIQQMAYGTRFYSQEYVSAMLADNEALKIRAGQQQSVAANNLEMFRKADERAETLLAELERYKQYAKERDAENESLALTIGRLRVELEAKDKRIAELEEGRRQLNLIINSEANRADAAEKRLATPVRLPDALIPAVHASGEPFMRPEPFGFYLNRDDVIKKLRAAGLTVEGGGEYP
ncbi:TPA: ead/Ea22-like family protein [Serratia marcescens]